MAVILLSVSSSAKTEPVNLSGANNLQAQAFTFSYGDNCYAILPDHAARRQLITLLRGDPTVVGQGRLTPIRFPNPETDLALAYVTGPLSETCVPRWSDLSADLSNTLRVNTDATLISLRRNGLQKNTRMKIKSVSYEHIELDQIDRNNKLGQGRSGSLIVVGNTPVGIAIRSNEEQNRGQITALRIDAIKNRLNRFITGASFTKKKIQIDLEPSLIPYQIDHWNISPSDPHSGPENLLVNNNVGFVFDRLDQTLKLDLRISGANARTVRKVTITSNVADNAYTIPKKITLLASNRKNKTRPRNLGTAQKEMSLAGEYRATVNTELVWLLVRIHSVWDQNKPVRIDSISIE